MRQTQPLTQAFTSAYRRARLVEALLGEVAAGDVATDGSHAVDKDDG